jgi:hypothetical protein
LMLEVTTGHRRIDVSIELFKIAADWIWLVSDSKDLYYPIYWYILGMLITHRKPINQPTS